MGKRPAQTDLQKTKSKRARRILQAREPKEVEDAKKTLLLAGNKTSQVVKDIFSDMQKLKPLGDAIRYTRKNPDARPFEIGGETPLEHFSQRTDCAQFALGSHSKKRPHNLVLGRFFDHRLYDVLELGVERYQGIKDFTQAAKLVQLGNKPCFAFVGEGFESVPELRMAKSLILDFFRGDVVDTLNVQGDTHIIVVAAVGRKLLFRHYSVVQAREGGAAKPKLAEMGPSLDLSLRRMREPPAELEMQALKQPKLVKKKEKNVEFDNLAGKVGRIYMPKQDLNSISLNKMKGLKRQRRDGAAGAAVDAAVDTEDAEAMQ